MKRSFLSLTLTLLFLLTSLTACAPQNHVGVDSSGLDPFVIGGIGPLTSETESYSTSVLQGAQLAVDEINATGGVNGFRLVLNFQDSKGNPETAVNVYEKLKSNGMKVLLGGVFSDETAALAEASEEDGMLIVTPTAGEKILPESTKNLFRVCIDSPRLGTAAAEFVLGNESDTAAVVYSDDPFGGDEISQAFLSVFAERGATAFRYSVTPDTDLTEIFTELNVKRYDTVFLALSSQDTEDFLAGYDGDSELLSVNPPADPVANDGLAVISSFFNGEDNSVMNNFTESYEAAYHVVPDRYAADAYDAVYAVAEAIKRAGVNPENADNADTNERLVDAMTKIDVNGVTGKISWTANGENNRNPSVRILKDGIYVPYTTEFERKKS